MQNVQVKEFLLLLRELQKIHPEFPLQYAVCLAEIASAEGISLTGLSEKTGMPLSTISRIIAALSNNKIRGSSYGLVRVVVSPSERRRKELYLTTRGHAVIRSISDILAFPRNDPEAS